MGWGSEAWVSWSMGEENGVSEGDGGVVATDESGAAEDDTQREGEQQ